MPVAAAIGEHYLPLSATAPLPQSLAGACVAVAEKIDNIVGAWVAGEKPTGSRDPFGLRRAAMGIVRITLACDLRGSLPELIEQALAAYAAQGREAAGGDAAAAIAAEVEGFVWERLQALLLDEGVPFEFVEAALAARGGLVTITNRALLARAFAAAPDDAAFADVITAYTRCASLAARARPDGPAFVDEALLREPAEHEVRAAVRAAAEPVRAALVAGDVAAALRAAATLRPPVDRYFDDILVMDDEPAVRDNRLAQLSEVTTLLGGLGDFSRLPVAGDQDDGGGDREKE